MARKFLSFLGAIAYEQAQYYFKDDKNNCSTPTPYVQAAIFEKELSDWQPEDQVYIFTTENARRNNYLNQVLRGGKDMLEDQGLQSVLFRLSLQGKIGRYEDVTIPDGNTESEIWTVFQTVFNTIEDGDELYFDITYGFRSLPMLGVVLMDYARTLRNVQIKRIFYGNYEAGRAETVPGAIVKAPVLDLLPFAQLQEWTAAARSFLDGGNAGSLAQLTEHQNPEISRNLKMFSSAILTCRGLQLNRDIDISSFKKLVDTSLGTPIAVQLRPLLEKVQEKLSPFSSNNLTNGLHAVKWCIDNGLIQQGFTFLQETIISLVIEKFYDASLLAEYEIRTDVGTALNEIKPNRPDLRRKKMPLAEYEQLFDYIQLHPDLTEVYKHLTGERGLRNDINHCGYRNNYASPKTLTEELENLYERFLNIKLVEYNAP